MALTLVAGLCKAQILFKKLCQTFDHAALLLGSVSATESGYRGQDSINIRSGGLQRAVPEGVVDKLSGFLRFQALCADDLIQILLLLLIDEILPIPLHYSICVDGADRFLCIGIRQMASGPVIAFMVLFVIKNSPFATNQPKRQL